MAIDSSIKHVSPVDDGLLVEFRDGRLALFPASFLRTYQPWFALDVPAEDDGDASAQAPQGKKPTIPSERPGSAGWSWTAGVLRKEYS